MSAREKHLNALIQASPNHQIKGGMTELKTVEECDRASSTPNNR